MSTIDELVRERIAARNFPTSPTSVEEVRSAGLTLEDLWLPTVIARESAIAHNLERFASRSEERRVGKEISSGRWRAMWTTKAERPEVDAHAVGWIYSSLEKP